MEMQNYPQGKAKYKQHFYPEGARVRVMIYNYQTSKDEPFFGTVLKTAETGFFKKSKKFGHWNDHKKKYKIQLDDGSIEYCYKFQVSKENKY